MPLINLLSTCRFMWSSIVVCAVVFIGMGVLSRKMDKTALALYIDFGFLVIATLCLASISLVPLRKMGVVSPVILSVAFVIPVAYGMLDFTENIIQLESKDPLNADTYGFKPAKFLFFGLGLAQGLILWAYYFARPAPLVG